MFQHSVIKIFTKWLEHSLESKPIWLKGLPKQHSHVTLLMSNKFEIEKPGICTKICLKVCFGPYMGNSCAGRPCFFYCEVENVIETFGENLFQIFPVLATKS